MEPRETLRSLITPALVTVIVTGGIGGAITHCYQEQAAESQLNRQVAAQEHELNKIWLENRGDNALESRKEYLKAQQAFVQELFAGIAKTVYAVDQMLDVPSDRWKLRGLSEEAKKEKDSKRKALVDLFNTAEADWRTNSATNGVKIAYYSGGKPEVLGRWATLSASLDSLLLCANNTYDQWHSAVVNQTSFNLDPETCKAEKLLVVQASDQLAQVVLSNTQYGWEGWESPQKMREELGMSLPETTQH